MFSQIKDIKHFKRNFHNVALVIPKGRDLVCSGSNILALGFAMEPYRLRILVVV